MTSFRERPSLTLFWIVLNITASPYTSMALLYGHPPMPRQKPITKLDPPCRVCSRKEQTPSPPKGCSKERSKGSWEREEEMKDQREIQIAWETWNLVEKLNNLLWDRYEEDFIEIYLKEEEDKFLHTIGYPNLTRVQDKTDGWSRINEPNASQGREADLLSPSLFLRSPHVVPLVPLILLCIRTANLSTAHPKGHSIRAQKGHSLWAAKLELLNSVRVSKRWLNAISPLPFYSIKSSSKSGLFSSIFCFRSWFQDRPLVDFEIWIPTQKTSSSLNPIFPGILRIDLKFTWNSDIRIEKNKKIFEKFVILKFWVVTRKRFKKASKWARVAW